MSGTCSPFPPFGDPWPSCLLPSETPLGFPDGASGKESVCGCRRLVGGEGSVLGLGRSPGGRSCTPLQHSCLEDSIGSGLQKPGGGGAHKPHSAMACDLCNTLLVALCCGFVEAFYGGVHKGR